MARYAGGGHQRPLKCKRCGKPATRSRTISRRGNCAECGKAALTDAVIQNAERRGPIFERAMQGALVGIQRALERSTQ